MITSNTITATTPAHAAGIEAVVVINPDRQSFTLPNAFTFTVVPRSPGDLNADGKSDILWQRSDGSTAIWLINGLSLSSGAGLLGPGAPVEVRCRFCRN